MARQAPGPPPPPNTSTTITATAMIRGRVLATNGAPISNAEVRVRGRDNRVVTTDEQGQFEVRDLTPGDWTVTATKSGYAAQQYGQNSPLEAASPVAVPNGGRVTIDLWLTRGVAVSGRVVDEFGDPLANVAVRAMRSQMVRGQRQLVAIGPIDQTDDLGAYRLYGLPPGDYYVSAAIRYPGNASSAEMMNVPTYHPGTVRASEAQTIRLRAGDDQFGIDVQAAATVPGMRVSGTVLTPGGLPAAHASLHLFDTFMTTPTLSASFRADERGRFSATNVRPGSYVIEAVMASTGPDDLSRGTVPVEVAGTNLEGITVMMRGPVTLVGSIVAEANGALPGGSEVGITARSLAGGGVFGSESRMVLSNGPATKAIPFKMPMLFGAYRFGVEGLPDGWMLRRFEVDGRDVTDTIVDLSNAGPMANARVVLTNRGAALSGTVDLAGARPASVVLFPYDDTKWTYPSRLLRAARTDAQGRFTIAGIPSERYLVAAVGVLEAEEFQDPEFLARMKGAATELRIAEGESRTVKLSLTSR